MATESIADVLAIAAHRDDVEQTCGGTLLRMAARGLRTAILDLTQGEAGTRGTAEDRAREAEEAARLLGGTPGHDLPALYLEHNAPRPHAVASVHPLADQRDIPIVHVTHFNELFWDNGMAPTTVIEHGIVDPGPLYTGELPHAAVVVNEPVRRGRTTGDFELIEAK